MTFGKRLRSLREAKGWRQEDLGNLVDSASSTVALWESDSRRPNIHMVARLAKVFAVSIDSLIDESEEKREHHWAEVLSAIRQSKKLPSRKERSMIAAIIRKFTEGD